MSDYEDFCACGYDDYDETACHREKIVTARKAAKCDECGGAINSGETYRRADWFYVADRCWGSWRICQPCLDGPIAFIEKNCGCVPHGAILDHLEQVFRHYQFKHPGVKFRVGRMIVGLRRRGGVGRSVVAR